jgi:hypothetical protein
MHVLEERAVDAEEDSLRRAGIMTASQEHVASSPRMTHADLSSPTVVDDSCALEAYHAIYIR